MCLSDPQTTKWSGVVDSALCTPRSCPRAAGIAADEFSPIFPLRVRYFGMFWILWLLDVMTSPNQRMQGLRSDVCGEQQQTDTARWARVEGKSRRERPTNKNDVPSLKKSPKQESNLRPADIYTNSTVSCSTTELLRVRTPNKPGCSTVIQHQQIYWKHGPT